MSTTTLPPTTPPAPWSSPLQSQIATLGKSPEFTLTTIAPSPTSPIGFAPRSRTVIYRGMWSVLPENKHNNAPRNPSIYSSDMLTFTTDIRMQKAKELFQTSAGKAEDEGQMQGSGGGGPVEAMFWISGEKTQWRVRGRGFVVGEDIEETRGDVPGVVSSGVRVVKSEIGGGMRVKEGMEGKEGEWSWGRELTGHWGNMSPGLRGCWKNPDPGTPTARGEMKGSIDWDRRWRIWRIRWVGRILGLWL